MVCALMVVPATARAADGEPPCPDGQMPDPSGLVCVFLDHTTTGLEVATTEPPDQDPWLTQALELQHRLGDALPLRDAMWVGTHNSFNSTAEMGPTLSDTDANQQLSLTDQLRIDVRSLELDVHWFPSAASGGARAPVVCHAESQHEGCSIEKELGPVLGEIELERDGMPLLSGDLLAHGTRQAQVVELDRAQAVDDAADVLDDGPQVGADVAHEPAGAVGGAAQRTTPPSSDQRPVHPREVVPGRDRRDSGTTAHARHPLAATP
jgi:hypothetical protein